MANLETLDLQINGSAEQAKGGIDKLISSLSNLSDALVKPFSDLVDFKKELASLSKIKLPDFSKAIGAGTAASMNRTRAAAKAVTKEFKANASIMKEFQKEAKDPAFKWQSWRYGPNPLPTIKNYTGATSLEDDERERREYEEGLEQHLRDLNEYHRTHDSNGYRIPEPITNASQSVDAAQQNQAIQQAEEATKRIQESANNASTALQNVSTAAENVNSSAADATSGLVGVDKELKRKKTDGDKAAGALQNVADEEKKTGEEGEKGSKGVSKFGKVLGSIGRIAQTLLIRTAIKSLYKAFSESWQAMYQFSKANDGAFAQSLERMKGLLHGATTNILTAFAPAIQALVPIVNVLAGAIQFLCNMVSQLFSLLGMSSEFFGASTDAVNAYTKSAKGGGGATKEMLASFDELNVITSAGGGGGGGGGGIDMGSGLIGAVSDDMAKLQMIVGESLLGIGLILACCGHIPLGIGLMAIGASAIVKTIVQDWGKLTDQTKQEIAEIMAACAVGFLALGFLLAATGHIGLGIGLMFLGASNMAGLVAMGFNGMLSEEMKQQAGKIVGIGGAVLFTAGLILAFAGHIGLGIGMMVAGGAAVATAAALNWDKIKVFISQNSDHIKDILMKVSAGMIAIGAILAFSGANVPIGIALIASGVAGLVAFSGLNWEKIKGLISNNTDGIAETLIKVSAGMLAIGAILTFSGASVPLGIALITGGIAGLVTAVGLNWDKIKGFISTNSGAISDILLKAGTGMLVVGAILTFSGANLPLGIGLMVAGAASIATAVYLNWDKIKGYIREHARGISEFLTAASLGMLALGAILLFTGISIPIGLGLIAAGAAGLAVSKALEADWTGVTNDISESCGTIDTAMQDPLATLTELVTQGDAWQKLGDLSKKITITVETVQKVKKITQGSSTVTEAVNKGLETAAELNNDGSIWGTIVNTVTKAGQAAMKFMGIPTIDLDANGAYGIDRGDLFIANEAGAELVGTINGKTSVVNQSQIIEGISNGVERAQSEQNRLLREQNDLLRGILDKDTSVRIGASAALGRVVNQSQQMYARQVGG